MVAPLLLGLLGGGIAAGSNIFANRERERQMGIESQLALERAMQLDEIRAARAAAERAQQQEALGTALPGVAEARGLTPQQTEAATGLLGAGADFVQDFLDDIVEQNMLQADIQSQEQAAALQAQMLNTPAGAFQNLDSGQQGRLIDLATEAGNLQEGVQITQELLKQSELSGTEFDLLGRNEQAAYLRSLQASLLPAMAQLQNAGVLQAAEAERIIKDIGDAVNTSSSPEAVQARLRVIEARLQRAVAQNQNARNAFGVAAQAIPIAQTTIGQLPEGFRRATDEDVAMIDRRQGAPQFPPSRRAAPITGEAGRSVLAERESERFQGILDTLRLISETAPQRRGL